MCVPHFLPLPPAVADASKPGSIAFDTVLRDLHCFAVLDPETRVIVLDAIDLKYKSVIHQMSETVLIMAGILIIIVCIQRNRKDPKTGHWGMMGITGAIVLIAGVIMSMKNPESSRAILPESYMRGKL